MDCIYYTEQKDCMYFLITHGYFIKCQEDKECYFKETSE